MYLESISPNAEVITATLAVPLIEQNNYAAVAKGFEVQLNNKVNCGDVLSFHVHISTEQGAKLSDPIDILMGYEQLKMDMLHDDVDWMVNPEAKDTVEAGAWKLGEPECSLVLGVVTQPERDHTPGEGKLSFHTGPKKGESFTSDDVDGGRTTVQSPIYSIGDARYPRLVYYAWHVAVDFTSMSGPKPITADLVTHASNDGGETWIEIDRINQNTENWLRRDIPLSKFLEPSNRTRFRFEIEDATQAGTVEAGIDDIEILDLVNRCEVPVHEQEPDQVNAATPTTSGEVGCSCATFQSVSDRSSLASLLLISLLGITLRSRRKLF